MALSGQTRLAYLSELARIDEYLNETRGMRSEPSASDPEVRRILEAAAFLAAQNQRISYQATFDALQSLVEQRLDFIVRPLPARGLIAAVPHEARTPLSLRQGTLVHLTTRDGRTVRLSTEVSAIIAPIRVQRAEWVESSRGPVLLFDVELQQSLHELCWLSLHVDVLGDLVRSLALHQLLSRRSRGAFLFQSGKSSLQRQSPELNFESAQPLDVSFGDRASVEADFDPEAFDVDRVLSPLEEIRAHFQFPERNLFINFQQQRGRNDDSADEYLSDSRRVHLGILFERGVTTSPISAACFRPNILPVQNLVQLPAQPIKDEGYLTRYPLRPPDELLWKRAEAAGGPFELQGIWRVLAMGGDEETPLLPTSLGDPQRSYRMTRSASLGDNQHYFELATPGTLQEPRWVRIEAEWCQPGLDLASLGQVKARLFYLATEGISWKLLPKGRGFIPSPVEGSSGKLVELLALTNRKRLNRDEIVRVLHLLVQGVEGPWPRVIEAIGSMKFEDVLSQDGRAALRRRVLVEMRPLPEELLPLFEDLLQRTAQVLSVWGHEIVEVQPQKSEQKSLAWEAVS